MIQKANAANGGLEVVPNLPSHQVVFSGQPVLYFSQAWRGNLGVVARASLGLLSLN